MDAGWYEGADEAQKALDQLVALHHPQPLQKLHSTTAETTTENP